MPTRNAGGLITHEPAGTCAAHEIWLVSTTATYGSGALEVVEFWRIDFTAKLVKLYYMSEVNDLNPLQPVEIANSGAIDIHQE